MDYLVLLRGVNVAGHNKLAMADLREALTQAGHGNVRTYIQSGNLALTNKRQTDTQLAANINALLQNEFSVNSDVWVLKRETLHKVIAQNPFQAATAQPKTLHVYFPKTEPKEEALAKLEATATNNEKVQWVAPALYLHAPGGIGRSKIVSRMDSLVGTPTTGRNWQTIEKLAAL
ncbi:MAG: DUF1697 domain-containing protein [Pseudomonadales bacterium]|nr:DUF1697 domain-containing protein [Pseudomonadales bacterium]